jgi:hypothetical protein
MRSYDPQWPDIIRSFAPDLVTLFATMAKTLDLYTNGCRTGECVDVLDHPSKAIGLDLGPVLDSVSH